MCRRRWAPAAGSASDFFIFPESPILFAVNPRAAIPLRRTFAATKHRLKGASTGHKLLKKKSDALTVRIRQILKEVNPPKRGP